MDSSASLSETSENIFLFVFISSFASFEVCIYAYFFDAVRWKIKLLTDQKFIKRKLRESLSNFDQWKLVSENYKPIKVWLWFVYKITENNCRSRLITKFIQTQKRCPTFLDEMSILTSRLFETIANG